MNASPRQRRWLILFVSLGALAGIVVAVLPLAVSYFAADWLEDHGADRVVIDDVDLNPFSGSFGLYGVQIFTGGNEVLTLRALEANLEMLDLVGKKVHIRELALSGFSTRIEQSEGALTVGSVVLPLQIAADEPSAAPSPEEEAAEPWGMGVSRLSIEDSRIEYRSPQISGDMRIDSLSMAEGYSWLPDDAARFDLALAVNGAPISLQGEARPFSTVPRLSAHLSIDGLDTAPLRPYLQGTGLGHADMLVDADQAIEYGGGPEEFDVSLSGTLSLRDIDIGYQEIRHRQGRLTWNGDLTYTASGRRQNAMIDGALAGEHIAGAYAPYAWQASQFGLTADIEYERDDGPVSLTGDARIEITGAKAVEQKKQVELGRFERLDLRNLQIRAVDAFDAERLRIEGIGAINSQAAGSEPLATLGSLEIRNIHVSSSTRVEIERIDLAALQASIERNEDGRILSLAPLLGASEAPAEEAQAALATTPPAGSRTGQEVATFSVGTLQLGGDSRVRFTDAAVTPPFDMALEKLAFRLSSLDSARPHHDSELSLGADIGEYAKIRFEGSVRPLAEKLTTDITGSITELDLPPLSPYTGRYLGYDIRRGQLDAELDVNIDQNEMKLVNKLHLRKINLAARDVQEARSLTDQLAMPLDKSLDLLRDKNGNIELEIPVTGNLADPQFELAPIFNKATANAMKLAASVYLKNALQPWGALMTAANLVGKAMKPKFEPLSFRPGTADLIEEHRAYVEKLTDLMVERPEIHLSLCGIANREDLQALRPTATEQAPAEEEDPAERPISKETLAPTVYQQLIALAEERGKKIKGLMLERGDIASDRLLLCKPSYDDSEGAEPAVTIGL